MNSSIFLIVTCVIAVSSLAVMTFLILTKSVNREIHMFSNSILTIILMSISGVLFLNDLKMEARIVLWGYILKDAYLYIFRKKWMKKNKENNQEHTS